MIEGVSRQLVMGSVKKAVDVSGNRVGGCDERRVHWVDVAAGYRPFGMSQQSGDGGFGEAEIIRDAGETMPQLVKTSLKAGRRDTTM